MSWYRVAFVSLVAAMALPCSALAQQQDSAAAVLLFKEGRAAAEKQDYATACTKFYESDRLEHAVGTVFNIADCEEHLGHLARAWALYTDVVTQLGTSDERGRISAEHADALARRLPKLTLRLARSVPPDAAVERDGVQLGAASLGLSLPVDAGDHVVVVKAKGRLPREFRVTLAEGATRELEVDVGALEPIAGAPTEVSPPSATPESDSGRSTRRTVGFVAGGLGLAGLAVGAVTGIVAIGKKGTVDDDCVDDVCHTEAGKDAASSGKTFSAISTVSFIAGGALLAGGVVLIATSGAGAARTALVVDPNAGGARLRWRVSF